MTSIKPEPDQSAASLSDRVSASARVPHHLTALDICLGLVFHSVLFPDACASVRVHTFKDRNETGM